MFKPLNKSLQVPFDIYTLLISAVLWGMLYFTTHHFIFKPIAQRLFPFNKTTKKEAVLNMRTKYVFAAWKFINFGIMVLIGFTVLSKESWSLSQKDYFYGWPNQPMSMDLKIYYNAEFGMYLFGLFTVFLEQEQTLLDLFVIIGHHIATLSLIAVSYLYSFHRIGCVIMLVHDVSDPFMEAAKMFLYAGYSKVADALFALFALVFIVSRTMVYPFFVLMSIYKYCRWPNGEFMPSTWFNVAFFQVPLWFLQALHIYWSILIIKMVIKALKEQGVSDDIRNKKVE